MHQVHRATSTKKITIITTFVLDNTFHKVDPFGTRRCLRTCAVESLLKHFSQLEPTHQLLYCGMKTKHKL